MDESYVDIVFSLVDYRNNYFTSNHPKKIIEFYDGFENRDQLIQWMRERPKGGHTIYEVEGDKDIIVVIPTADYNGKFAKECKENIFKGLHIVFVESGGDFYFNYAHNYNIGIKKAMEYNPKWVVVSNDDMFKMDNISVLVNDLQSFREPMDVIFAMKDGKFNSNMCTIGKFNSVGRTILFLSRFLMHFSKRYYLAGLSILNKYSVTHIARKPRIPIVSTTQTLWNVNNFSIFSYDFLKRKNGSLLDEIYKNGYEDVDASLQMLKDKARIGFVNFRIGSYAGGTLGLTQTRSMREIANIIYFNHKIDTNMASKDSVQKLL